MILLVMSRLLSPGSKKKAWDQKERFFERFDFSLDDVYRSLSHFHEISEDLQRFLHESVRMKYGSDTSTIYYDVTNYYFEIRKPDEKFDGFYAIITSEVKMPDAEVVKTYHGLWEIEHSFRITKNDLKTRPVHVSLENRISANFLTCFIALLIVRLLTKRLGEKYAPEQIIQSLKRYQACYIKDNVYRVSYYDQLLQDAGTALNLTLNRRFLTVGGIRQLVADSKKEF